jgi:PAS domain-containing protein
MNTPDQTPSPADAPRAAGPASRSAAELRCRAEARLKGQRTEDRGPRTELERARLVHELELHQIELEMQNEELQQARAEVDTLLARYTDLYDFAPTGYFNLARDGTILAVNLTGARLLGFERARLLNRRFGFLVSSADRPVFNAFLEKTFAGKDRECFEVALLSRTFSPMEPPRRDEGSTAKPQPNCAKRLECVELAPAFEPPRALRQRQQAGHLHTLRVAVHPQKPSPLANNLDCCSAGKPPGRARRSLFASRPWFPRAGGSAAPPCWMSPTATAPRRSKSD